MKLHPRIAATALGAATLALSLLSPAAPAGAEVTFESMAYEVVELTNLERDRAGLPSLEWNETLAIEASWHAQDMAVRDYFGHYSPEGTSPSERARLAGYPGFDWGPFVGENIAKGLPTSEGVVQSWLNSEGHRQNLLLPDYREIGVGLSVAPDGSVVWVQNLGARPAE